MWLTESQIQFIMEALVPPALQAALDKEGVSHLVDRHDAMYLASKNTQYPDTEGQHEWRITSLTKGHGGGTHNVAPSYHFSYKDPAVLASYMKKIHTAPEHWNHIGIHGMLTADGPEGRRGGVGERLYPTTPERESEHKKAEDYAALRDWEANFDTLMQPYKESVGGGGSNIYENAIADIVDGLLEDTEDTSMLLTGTGFVSMVQPHMPLHKRNKMATVMAGAVGNTPS